MVLGTVRPRGQLEQLVGGLRYVYRAGQQDALTVGADYLALVVGILVGWSRHVAVRQGWQRTGLAYFHLRVVELLFAVGYVFSVSGTSNVARFV